MSTHPTETRSAPDLSAPARPLRRLTTLFLTLLALVLLALALPFLNINRFQRRIARSLAESLGRPVHFDRISLAVLPLPGLTIENFVVGEDPAFGAEPFIRANQVRATLRLASLWSRRVEFSRITFTDPSINLVKLPDGRWNLQSILLQAARIDAAPTAQPRRGAAPRFPYIEATGARLNLKLGPEKTPFSLTEADCALWLPDPRTWQLRLEGRPMRTDTPVSETGTFHLEGTLGRAPSWPEVPLDLKAAWRNVPLGEASRFVLARDAGLRGTITLDAAVRGAIGHSDVQTAIHLADLRRADFVPAQTLTLDAECQAVETGSFHAFNDIRCAWPPTATPSTLSFALPSAEPKTLALTGSIPDIRRLDTAAFDLGTPGIPAATLLTWLRVASPRVSPGITATGSLSGTASFHPGTPATVLLTLSQAALTVPTVAATPILTSNDPTANIVLRSSQTQNNVPPSVVLSPIAFNLGGRIPAVLDARFSPSGYTLRLTGTALPTQLRAFAAALPQIGDGLPDAIPVAETDTPIRLDLTSIRTWTGPRVWRPTPSTPAPRLRRRH